MNRIDPSNLLPELEYMDYSAVTLDTTIPTSDTYLRQALLEVHEFKCFYSRDPITADTFHIEHIHPRSLGGRDCIGNYVPANMRMNMMKMVAYDEIHTKQLLAINRLTFARKVLKRYLQLKKAAQKRYPQIGQIDHRKYLHTVKIPNGIAYYGGEYLDLIIKISKLAVYRNLQRDHSLTRERFTIELQLMDEVLAEEVFQLGGPIGRGKGVIFSSEGALIPEYLNPGSRGGCSMCPHIKYTASKKLLEVDYEVPSNEERYPENCDAMRYFRELSQKIESIMN